MATASSATRTHTHTLSKVLFLLSSHKQLVRSLWQQGMSLENTFGQRRCQALDAPERCVVVAVRAPTIDN
eukprot:1682072-Alexandrium_andersonii.AAC.2